MSEVALPYEVAVWRWWPTTLFPAFATVHAPSSRQAVLAFLEEQAMKQVARVAVQSPDGSIERWVHVDVEALRHGHVTVEVPLVWRNGRVVRVLADSTRERKERAWGNAFWRLAFILSDIALVGRGCACMKERKNRIQ